MKFPDEPRHGQAVIDTMVQLMRWCRANNLTSVANGFLKESPNGKTLIVAPQVAAGGVVAVGRRNPWQAVFFKVDDIYKVKFNLGTVNNVAASNWNAEHTLATNDPQFVLLTIQTASGKVTGLTISLASQAPAEDTIAKDTPPVTHRIVLGVVTQSSGQMIVDTNLIINGAEVFRESKVAPATGAEPFSRWWRWNAQPV